MADTHFTSKPDRSVKTHVDVAEIVRRYLAGESSKSIARSFNVGARLIRDRLEAAGITLRTPAEANRNLDNVAIEEIARLYQAGMSMGEIARSLDLTTRIVAYRMKVAGITPRPQSERTRIAWSKATPSEREHWVKAAHDALRGKPMTTQRRRNLAIGKEGRRDIGSPTENELADRLKSLDIRLVQQKECDGLNIDIALPESRIAVEVYGTSSKPKTSLPLRYRTRTRFLIDAGWLPVVVLLCQSYPMTGLTATSVASIHQARIGGNPYWSREVLIIGDSTPFRVPVGLKNYKSLRFEKIYATSTSAGSNRTP